MTVKSIVMGAALAASLVGLSGGATAGEIVWKPPAEIAAKVQQDHAAEAAPPAAAVSEAAADAKPAGVAKPTVMAQATSCEAQADAKALKGKKRRKFLVGCH